jgi:hypothetical protein
MARVLWRLTALTGAKTNAFLEGINWCPAMPHGHPPAPSRKAWLTEKRSNVPALPPIRIKLHDR